jgi:hypothetical protein
LPLFTKPLFANSIDKKSVSCYPHCLWSVFDILPSLVPLNTGKLNFLLIQKKIMYVSIFARLLCGQWLVVHMMTFALPYWTTLHKFHYSQTETNYMVHNLLVLINTVNTTYTKPTLLHELTKDPLILNKYVSVQSLYILWSTAESDSSMPDKDITNYVTFTQVPLLLIPEQ